PENDETSWLEAQEVGRAPMWRSSREEEGARAETSRSIMRGERRMSTSDLLGCAGGRGSRAVDPGREGEPAVGVDPDPEPVAVGGDGPGGARAQQGRVAVLELDPQAVDRRGGF